MLKPLSRVSHPTHLVPRSGIQFLDLGFATEALSVKDWQFYADPSRGDGPARLVLLDRDAAGDTVFTDPSGTSRVVEASFGVTLKQVVDTFHGRWVPLPMLRVEPGYKFASGPTNWARLRLVDLERAYGTRDEQGYGLRVVVAIDTDLMPQDAGRPYLAPTPQDAKAGRQFGLASDLKWVTFLLGQHWFEQWLFELYKEGEERLLTARAPTRPARVLSEDEATARMQGSHEHLARYVALLHLLGDLEIMPKLVFIDTETAPRRSAIEVDLVLDVGNSRTCGILIEANPERGINLNDSYRLELRDLSQPELVHAEPFESRIEFAQAAFGKEHLSHLSGRSNAFLWPTITRVGVEAQRLASHRAGSEGNTGMSSPKRYLWDEEPRAQSWRFNGTTADGELEPYANQGLFVQLVNEAGEPLDGLAEDDPGRLPALQALYSRSSLMSFALAEILLQAAAMINSPGQRQQMAHGTVPRRLRRIILTIPTAMPLAERQILDRRATAAARLVWQCLGWDGRALADGGAEPEVVLKWDEASCTQLVYLYTEVARNFGGDARAFFATLRRPDSEADGTIRIASIDIGGGTTDLIVTRYAVAGRGTSVTLLPRPELREGFNIAGDDVLYRIIQLHLLPVIEASLKTAGVVDPLSLTSEMFGGDRGGQRVEEQTRRQQFAAQILMPMALGVMAAYEQYDATADPPRLARPFASFFAAEASPSLTLVGYFNRIARQRGAVDYDIAKLEIPIDLAGVDDTVRGVLGEPLQALAEIVLRTRTDVLLLSGRPSRLPAVRAILLEAAPLPPDRIVPLHRFRVGTWYPFRDLEARIADPKTTAAVGAMVGVLAEGHLENFSFRSDTLRPLSTIRVIGKLEAGGLIKEEDVYFRDVDLEDPEWALPPHPIEYRVPMAIGFRQFANEWWPGTRLYSLGYAGEEARRRLHAATPLAVVLRRAPKREDRHAERLDIAEATDREGRPVNRALLSLRLQTIGDAQGYWLDTGVLKVN